MASSKAWFHRALQLDDLRARGLLGHGVGVGLVDTGIDPHHADLNHQPASYCAWDALGRVMPNASPTDEKDHGTQVAGVICGRGRSPGIAPECRLHLAAALTGGPGVSTLVEALHWMLERPIRVLCLPTGVPGPNPIFERILERFLQRNVVVVCAVGNQGVGQALSPADSPLALSVGAIDEGAEVPDFSGSQHRYGESTCLKPDLLAPGVDVSVPTPRGYTLASGTSIACAFVAGVIALLVEAAPGASAQQIMRALSSTSAPLKNPHAHRASRGVVQPADALAELFKPNQQVVFDEVPPHRPDITRFVDPFLETQCRHAHANYLLDVVILSSGPKLKALIEHHRPQLHRVKIFDGLNIAKLRAEAHFVRELLHDEALECISAAQIDQTRMSF